MIGGALIDRVVIEAIYNDQFIIPGHEMTSMMRKNIK